MQKYHAAAFLGLWIYTLSWAKTVSGDYQMTPDVMKAVITFRDTHSESELLQALSMVQDPDERASQVLMASKNILDIDGHNNILVLLFQQRLNATHIPLMVDLYVKAAQTKNPASAILMPRVIIGNSTLESRLMFNLAGILHLPMPFKNIKPGDPLPRLLQQLESARDSSSLSDVEHKMVEDAIIFVKDSMGNNNELKNINSTSDTTPSTHFLGQTPASASTPVSKSMVLPPKSEPSSVPWGYIVLPLLAIVSLFGWWHYKK